MRSLVLTLAAVALLLSGCGKNACEELGDRLCDCSPAGTTKSTCEQGIKAEIDRLNPNGDVRHVCEEKLGTCYARIDPSTNERIGFCDWIAGRCGKASCGLSAEDYADLSDPNKTPDPDDPSSPPRALCPR